MKTKEEVIAHIKETISLIDNANNYSDNELAYYKNLIDRMLDLYNALDRIQAGN